MTTTIQCPQCSARHLAAVPLDLAGEQLVLECTDACHYWTTVSRQRLNDWQVKIAA